METQKQGSFTLPGEAGYERLTMELARRWGADVIRDSDGTRLSDEITSAGYDIYSIICLVRADNDWARRNPDKLQQNYLMSFPVTARDARVRIRLLDGYSRDQFVINSTDDPSEWWQVFDRTAGEEVPKTDWTYDDADGSVVVSRARPWHDYTVNFLVVRVWEEISMYNHITNGWGDRERLMAVDPRYPETRAHILEHFEAWLREHPQTSVVRFTSLFYNFAWFWGDDPDLRFTYSDWGSYDFTVSPAAIEEFEREYGYRPSSEDFVNAGRYNATHNVPSKRYRDWMDFVNRFVVSFGKECVDLAHRYGKKAFVFYDDHWIGVEPYGPRFREIGFDGIIKCVFSAFEARLCAGVSGVHTRELRLHPYLFPTGLGGEPTFQDGGDPALDARRFWSQTRRALLRAPVDRIGLGGYLHLVEGFPDFIDTIAEIADEFRSLKSLHRGGKPRANACRTAVLTAWGNLRSWSCSGHYHEHPELELINALESLAGLPVEVDFLSFDDVLRGGIPAGVKVILNAGKAGSAWSGGEHWRDPALIETVSAWVDRGGAFVGIGEPSAVHGEGSFFRLANVLGVDREIGLGLCSMKRRYTIDAEPHFIMRDCRKTPDFGNDTDGIFLTDGTTRVLSERGGTPRVAVHEFGQGRAVYLSGFAVSPLNTRLLHRALVWAARAEDDFAFWTPSNVNTECAWFPESGTLVVINNGDEYEETEIRAAQNSQVFVRLEPFEISTVPMRTAGGKR